jgi:serine phosphatase RsbU (regulator of sigma subunit)/anti-sigma regulatory factor (Ser/Thr protein kinase)
MASILRRLRWIFTGPRETSAPAAPPVTERVERVERAEPLSQLQVDIAPEDPLVAFFERAPDPIVIDKIPLDSPGARALREAGVRLVVPLVSQGELVGLLNLGVRMGEQQYSADDRVLLNNLATQAAPAVRVAQLAQKQQLEAQARERIEQELRVARLIQQTLLPKELPALPGWNIAAYYQPARAVGGDFYDFIQLPDGRLGIVIGDVTDKGVPAALMMATTRSTLRATALDGTLPGEVLRSVNERLLPEMPPKMFVTCLYAILDPIKGSLCYANAGHDLPFRSLNGSVAEMRATGMPLGLLPGMQYEEKITELQPGESVLLYSDGLVEAHDPQRQMFGFPRLGQLMRTEASGSTLIDYLLAELAKFTGPDWEQEDDVTLVVLHRSDAPPPPLPVVSHMPEGLRTADEWQPLAAFNLPSAPGNEREAMRRVADAVSSLNLPSTKVEQLKTAVAEATMNAIEHGNQFQPELPVEIEVLTSRQTLLVRIADQGANKTIPPAQIPDLDAKLAGLQSPRGWGLFLIEKMVDKVRVYSDETHHTVELLMNLN